jgi:peptide/nickel transport system ATP-binding protein
METGTFVLCDNLVKIYKVADLEVIALQGLDLELKQGEMMALVGPSGAGKSTLLNVIGGLDTPSAGEVSVAGWDLLKMKRRDRVKYQREVVGFVWQQTSRNLIPYLNARENVELPMQLNGVKGSRRKKRAMELLDMVHLADRAQFRPDQLSGGQQQRVALAVALSNNPPLLLGDELTGQVDSSAAERLFEALRSINQAYNTTIVVVTHDPLVASRMDRVVAIRDGRTSTEIRRRRNKEDGGVHEEEWVILDQVGRLQLPRDYIDTLEMRERVKVRLEPDHVSVWPQKAAPGSTTAARPSDNGSKPVHIRATETPLGVPVLLKNICRTFERGIEKVHALEHVSLEIPSGCVAVVKGPSGSGKTTLLNLIAGLDEPTAGSVIVGAQPLARMSAAERIEMRRRRIGFVFQTFGLLPFLSVQENVQVPLRLLGASRREREHLTAEVLDMVGLAERARHRTYELSGGEQQRVAIARALVKRPALVLADEPTGQLDTLTGTGIINLLTEIAGKTGVTVVVASHDPKVEEAADWIYELRDGHLVAQVEQRREADPARFQPSAAAETAAGQRPDGKHGS